MRSWIEFSLEAPEIADLGKQMLLQTRANIGFAFLATIRKDGGPRLHPISLVFSTDHLFVFISPVSPKCGDLERDGRYALQAFPPADNQEGREFYISGCAVCISDPSTRQTIIAETGTFVEEHEMLFELLVDKAMYTILVDRGAPNEHPWHRIWPTPVH